MDVQNQHMPDQISFTHRENLGQYIEASEISEWGLYDCFVSQCNPSLQSLGARSRCLLLSLHLIAPSRESLIPSSPATPHIFQTKRWSWVSALLVHSIHRLHFPSVLALVAPVVTGLVEARVTEVVSQLKLQLLSRLGTRRHLVCLRATDTSSV